MAIGQITLKLSGVPDLVISPGNASARAETNLISFDTLTAYGARTIQGITERSPRFNWRIQAWMRAWEFARFRRMVETQQSRLGGGSGSITLEDRVWFTDSVAASESGRSTLSSITENGETLAYCSFLVLISVSEGYSRLLRKYDSSLETVQVDFVATEV